MIGNPLQMNDWAIKRFLITILICQIILLILAILSNFGITIPLIQQIIGFIYLTILPGAIILRIMRMHNQGSIITLLYTVGLSLTFNMFLGFLINLIYPTVGIAHPISPLPLFITWAVVLGLLCGGAYLRDKNNSYPTDLKLAELLSPSVLVFILLPLLAIAGTQVVNYYNNNIVLLVLIALIALMAIVILTTKIIPTHIYPLAVFSIALALLWHSSLISGHLTGWYIFDEYYYYSLVVQNGIWDSTIPHTYNAMLSVTILPAVWTFFLNMQGEAVFKVIYPVLYALVPMALYMIYDQQLGSKKAFASVFIFMSIFVFSLMTTLARQMIGELFLVLLLMLIINKQVTDSKKFLFILFGAGLVVSHYSLSYIFIAYIILSLVFLSIYKDSKSQITVYAVILFAVICLSWYVYISSSAPLNSVLSIGKDIYQHAITNFSDMFNTEATSILMQTVPNTIHLMNRIVYYLVFFFTAVGALRLLPGRNINFTIEYLAFAFGSYALLAASIIIPFLSQSLSVQRIFHLSIMILAPFTILGIKDTIKLLGRLTRFSKPDIQNIFGKVPAILLLTLFFLFESGFVFEVVHDRWVNSLSLNLGHIEKNTRDIEIESKIALRNMCPTEQEISSAEWLKNNKENESLVFAALYDYRVPSLEAYGLIPAKKTFPIMLSDSNNGIGQGYIYLGYVNIIYGYGGTSSAFTKGSSSSKATLWDINELDPILNSSFKIYDNAASQIFFSP